MELTADYQHRYTAGWTTGRRGAGLDRADADGRSADRAWMDGYSDAAAGREKWHTPRCPDHEKCP